MSWMRSIGMVGVIIVIAAGYRVYSELAGPRLDEGIQKAEADMKKTLPLKVDEVTTLRDVKYERTKNYYWFVIDTKGKMPDARSVEQHVRQNACSNSEVARTIKEKGFSYEYHYANEKGNSIANIVVKSCP